MTASHPSPSDRGTAAAVPPTVYFAILAAVMLGAACVAVAGEIPAPEPSAESDAAVEAFLSAAEIVERKPLGVGITGSEVVVLEMDGRKRRAALKTVDIQNMGVTRFASKPTEMNFRDYYGFERAAYLLDRELGMHMVPVAVIRTVDGKKCALVDWVEDAMSEFDRREKKLQPPDPEFLAVQRAVMSLFDALILNVDRNLGNQLVTADGKLHLIDHSRAFRSNKKLSDAFLAAPASLPEWLLPRLENLDAKELKATMKGVLSGAQVKSVMVRRDLILEKIAADRERYGDDMIFQRLEPKGWHVEPED